MPFYYPNWINDFWRILGLVFFDDKDHFCVPGEKRFDEAAIRAFCAARGLAFYDTACEVRRLKDNASDAFLEVVTPTDVAALLRQIPRCHTLVTTGQKATEIVAVSFGCPVPPVGSFVDIVMPDPDRASHAPASATPGPDPAAPGPAPATPGAAPVTPGAAPVMPGCDRASHTLRFWRMPSTSRAYPLPLARKASAYQRLFLPKRLILWNLDGTLIDTLEDLGAAVNHALELRGLPLHTNAEYRHMVGHGVRNLVQQALNASLSAMPVIPASTMPGPATSVMPGPATSVMPGPATSTMPGPATSAMPGPATSVMPGADRASDALVDAALADFKAYYSAHIDVHTHPYPGIPALLTELQACGVRMAVTSNKFQEGTEKLIREFFPHIDFVSILGNRPGFPLKPSPEIVEEVLAKAGIGREEAMLVGDSPTDMRTAANGGIDALAVTWGYRTPEELSGHRLVGTVRDLRDVLLGLK